MRISKCEKLMKGAIDANTYRVETEDGQILFVPHSEDNSDYQELMKQEREGKITIEEVDIQG
jgi:hypothetical protein